jgi:hypothetical protein
MRRYDTDLVLSREERRQPDVVQRGLANDVVRAELEFCHMSRQGEALL